MQSSNKFKQYLQFTFKADPFRNSFLLRSGEQSYPNVLTFYIFRVRGGDCQDGNACLARDGKRCARGHQSHFGKKIDMLMREQTWHMPRTRAFA